MTVAASAATQTSIDRWRLWPAAIALAAVTVLIFLCGWPGPLSFGLSVLSGLGCVSAAVALIVSVCVFAVRRRPCKAASAALALVAPILFCVPITLATEYLHLGLMITFGVGQLGSVPIADDQHFAVYDWSTGLVGGPDTFVIHAPTDKIARPLARNRAAAPWGFGAECAGRSRHLLGHYYLCVVG